MLKSLNQQEISWIAPEFIHYPKSRLWFLAVSIIGLGLAVYFLVRKDFLTAVLFILLLLVVLFFAKSPAKQLRIHLDHSGIKINNLKLPYQQVKSFWIVYEPPEVKTINFETSAYLNRFVTLQLDTQDPMKIRSFLLQYLSEDLEKGELLADKLSRNLRF